MFRAKELKERLGAARKRKNDAIQQRRKKLAKLDRLMNNGADRSEIEDLKNEILNLKNQIEDEDFKISEATDALLEMGEDPNWHKNGNDFPDFLPGAGNKIGGRKLDEEGKVRLYHPGEKLSADHSPPAGEHGIDLGSYLRAVVQGPRTPAERTAVQNSITSDNYELPVHISAELIDRLRAANPLLRQGEGGAGARTLSIEGGETKFIKITGDMSAVWHAELVEETPDDPTFGAVAMTPKTVLALTEIGRETLQDATNISEALTASFVGSINKAILEATFTGAGTTDEPEGLSTVVTQTEEYTNGGSPDWSHFVNAMKTLHDNNVPEDNRSFVYAPDIWQTLALIQDNNNRYQDAPSFIRNVPRFTTSGVTDGQAYAGDFSNLVYGFRMNFTLEQFPAAAAKKYGSIWVAAARLDIATFRPAAFVRIEEAAA